MKKASVIICLLLLIGKFNAQTSNIKQDKIIGVWEITKSKDTSNPIEDVEINCSKCGKFILNNTNNLLFENFGGLKEVYSWEINGNKIHFVNKTTNSKRLTLESDYEFSINDSSEASHLLLLNKNMELTLKKIK